VGRRLIGSLAILVCDDGARGGPFDCAVSGDLRNSLDPVSHQGGNALATIHQSSPATPSTIALGSSAWPVVDKCLPDPNSEFPVLLHREFACNLLLRLAFAALNILSGVSNAQNSLYFPV
jgi:hypothetical protein